MGETLGVGSFGEVRVGTLPSGEHCAVKVRGLASRLPSVSHTHCSAQVMDPRKLSGTSLSEMRNEVNALAKLRHVNVIRYFGMVADGSVTSRWCNDECLLLPITLVCSDQPCTGVLHCCWELLLKLLV